MFCLSKGRSGAKLALDSDVDRWDVATLTPSEDQEHSLKVLCFGYALVDHLTGASGITTYDKTHTRANDSLPV